MTRVRTLIEKHRRAVEADERCFDANCVPFDRQEAKAAGQAEARAFREMVRQPCVDWSDVELKLTYLTTGSVGIRNTLLECLDLYSTGRTSLGADLVRSMVPALPREPNVAHEPGRAA